MIRVNADNRWTALAALSSAFSGIVCAVVGRRKREDQTPALHERVAILEKRLDDIDNRKATDER